MEHLAFVVVASTTRSAKKARRPQTSRRHFLRFAAASVCFAATSAYTDGKQAQAREWNKNELCAECGGAGDLLCTYCEGSGILTLGDAITENTSECPTCLGRGKVQCLTCIGLGLANTNGILRDASRDGRIRMRRDGKYEVQQCDAFPSCDIYGRGRPEVPGS